MRSYNRLPFMAALAASLCLAIVMSVADAQPAAAKTPAATGPAPAAIAIPTAVVLPPMLQGAVTLDEFKQYLAFQEKLRNNRAISELNTEIREHVEVLRQLQVKLDALRNEALNADPAAKALGEKIQKALLEYANAQTLKRAQAAAGPRAQSGDSVHITIPGGM